MLISYAAKTDVGIKRKLNEDSYCADEEAGLFLVADGMGGHAAGEVASSTAVEVIKNSVLGAQKKSLSGREAFVKAVELANRAVFEMAQKGAGMRGMGTTVAGVLIGSDGSLTAANVGDSRVYRIRDGKMEQLSVDHSMVALHIAMGLITKEEAKKSAHKNVITRAVGTSADVEVEAREEKIASGDILLICSDGLSSLVEDEDILEIALRAGNDLSKVCEELVSLANFNGGDDNITVVMVRFSS